MFKVDQVYRVKGLGKYLALIGVLCFLAYARGLPNLFVAEDFSTIVFSSLDFDILWKLGFTANRVRPFPFYISWLLYRVVDTDPVGYHLFVLIAHTFNCFLVFLLSKQISKDERVALLASFLFSVYPRHHQPVLWFSAYQFVIVGTFMLASLIFFDAYLQTRKARFQVGTCLCACLAAMSNELGVTVLPLMFLMEVVFWQSRQQGWQNLIRIKTYLKYLPYLALLAVYLYVTFGGERLFKLDPEFGIRYTAGEGWRGETYHLTLGPSMLKDMVVYLTYLVYPQIHLRSLDVNLLTGILSGGTALFLLFLFVKGKTITRFAILWIGITLLPFVLFVPFGNADRYFYVTAMGLSLLGGYLGCWVYDKLQGRFASVVRVAAILGLGMYLISSVTFIQQRIDEWREAGRIAADIVGQAKRLYPGGTEDSTILFVGLPGQYEHAYVFLGGGIGGAIYLAYEQQPAQTLAYQTRDPAVVAFLEKAEPVAQPLPGLYVFLYDDGVLYNKTNVVDDLTPLRQSTWYR